jgi:hypothetical protein
MLDAKFFMNIAPNVTARFRAFVFGTESQGKKAKQVHGKPYPEYTPSYRDKKRTGKNPNQDPEYRMSRAPVFSGATQRQFKAHTMIRNGFKFGTTRGGIVKSLADRGRIISSKAKVLPDTVEDYILKEASKYIKNKFKKIKGSKNNI